MASRLLPAKMRVKAIFDIRYVFSMTVPEFESRE